MLPFPNDLWRSAGGGSLELSDTTFPRTRGGEGISAAGGGWNGLDGFPVFPSITTYWPHLTDQSIDNMPRVRIRGHRVHVHACCLSFHCH